MSTERRHANVINVNELEGATREKGSRFGCTMRWLGRAAGARGVGCTHYEQPPGRTAFPKHFHTSNEEALFVLEGRGEVQIGDAVVEIHEGDWVTFPVGPDGAHRVTNTGDTTLRYLCLSTMNTVDVVTYPDSGKVGVFARDPQGPHDAPPWTRAMFKAAHQVDYYEGENTEG